MANDKTPQIPDHETSAFQHGRRAHMAGKHRILCNPASPEEERLWLAGWDAANDEPDNLKRAHAEER